MNMDDEQKNADTATA
jgi:hypothetical protein